MLADFSRLPWNSKATIGNIMGAGYRSIPRLASAEPKQLYADFFRYGQSMGKNLKLGNEIENSHYIAKILPVFLQDDRPPYNRNAHVGARRMTWWRSRSLRPGRPRPARK